MVKKTPLASTDKAANANSPAESNWMDKVRIPPAAQILSANELISITALIAYVAHRSNSNEYRVERNVADRFNVPNVKCLPADAYDDAIRYLVDSINGIVRI